MAEIPVFGYSDVVENDIRYQSFRIERMWLLFFEGKLAGFYNSKPSVEEPQRRGFLDKELSEKQANVFIEDLSLEKSDFEKVSSEELEGHCVRACSLNIVAVINRVFV